MALTILASASYGASVCSIKQIEIDGKKMKRPELIFIDLEKVAMPSQHNLSLFDATWIGKDLLIEFNVPTPVAEIDFFPCHGKPWTSNAELVSRDRNGPVSSPPTYAKTGLQFLIAKDTRGAVREISSLRFKVPKKICLGRIRMMVSQAGECTPAFARSR